MKIPFVGPSYELNSVNVDLQRTINLMPTTVEVGNGKTATYFEPTPGLVSAATLPATPSRGLYRASTGDLYAVYGSNLYLVTSVHTYTLLGAMAVSNQQVSMADNGLVLMVACGSAAYTYTFATSTFAQLTDSDFTGADFVQFVDGYFIWNIPDSGRFAISGLYSTTVDSLDFATSEASPDKITNIVVNNRVVWVFNEQTTELYYNSGDSNFPFSRVQGGTLETGTLAPNSVAYFASTIMWLSNSVNSSPQVMMSQGYTATVVSTSALAMAINEYTVTTDAVGYGYVEDGRACYMLSFPTENKTWCYDITNKSWHERVYLESNGTFSRHRSVTHAYAYNRQYVGDHTTGALYYFNKDTYTDAGNLIVRERTFPHIASEQKGVTVDSLQLEAEVGVGLTSGQGSDPQVMLQWSYDGGHSWSNEYWRSAGAIGNYKARMIWRRLGLARDRVFRIRMTDPVKCVWIDCFGELSKADS